MNIHARRPLREASLPVAENSNINNASPETSKVHEADEIEEDIDDPDTLHGSQEYLNQDISIENGVQKTVEPLYTPESAAPPPPRSSSLNLINGVLLACLLVVVACVIRPTWPFETSAETKNCTFAELSQRNPTQQASVWNHLRVGIENILNGRSKTTGVYLFVHHGGEHVLGLVREIAKESSSCFDQERKLIEVERDDFLSTATDDYGPAIEKFKEKIKEGKVILIANLNEIPPNSARALHAICDTYNPIAKDIVIFLTLVVESADREISLQKTQDTLYEMWAPELANNEVDALITRVTDEVIVLH